ncbi:unnamed protein product [Urochloa decumbens]|uniref:C2H2-type domain-containing protein n=1 Tax=Urochloa decumbens TaxID=240449 RepID=A0ABC9D027_9POAL
MALATLLLPSSSASTAAAAGDHSGSQRHDHHHGSKRKKKPPPPSPQPSLSSAPRTPTGSRSQRGMAAVSASSSSNKSPKVARPQYQQHHRVPSTAKKAAAAASSSSSSWEQVKSLLSCRSATAAARVHDPAAPSALARLRGSGAGACGASLCAMRDVVDAASSAASSSAAASASADRDTAPLNRRRAHRAAGSSSSSAAAAAGSHHPSLRGLSGCYECRAINVEPMSRRYPRPRELCACPQCGEVFTKADSLEHHQAIRHAVSELGPEDSGRNIVEIIFKSSWQKRDVPICHVDRILKVHNPPRTVARFEAYRDAVRSRCGRATAGARAAADGNELLRFHSAPLACALGLAGATSLCAAADTSSRSGDTASSSSSSSPAACCGVCAAIRHGFAPWVGAHPLGVRTTASSGRAHDCGGGAPANAADNGGCRAMLVCRVIAGRVRRDGAASAAGEEKTEGTFDSVAGEDAASSSVYGNLEELFVANPRAILPCFVVIYRVLES